MSDARNPSDLRPTDLLTAEPTPALVTELLHEVIDPELGVNIVDLGLVYDVAVDDGDVWVQMTLTTPACPLGGYMEDEIRAVLQPVAAVHGVEVDLVWDPPWRPEAMSATARDQMGWSG